MMRLGRLIMQNVHHSLLLALLASLVATGCAAQRSARDSGHLLSETNAVPGSSYDLTAYVIAKGDSLFRIAKQFGTTIKELLRLNPELDQTQLKIGQVIRVREERRQ